MLFRGIKLTVFLLAVLLLACSVNALPTNVSDCANFTAPNYFYQLNQSVSAVATCFNITAANVTLDCNGFGINYSSANRGYGVQSNSTNTTIENCGFINQTNATPNYSSGVLFEGASNSTVYNNTIITTGNDASGVYLDSGSNNSNITSNNISTVGAFFGAGIAFYESSNGVVSSNNISTTGSWGEGVYLETDSNNNILSGNTILTTGYSGWGIYLDSDSNSNNVSSNNISTTGRYGRGIYLLYSSNSNNISSNNISVAGEDADGISLYASSSSNYFSGNTILATGLRGRGVSLDDASSSNNFSSNGISSSGAGVLAGAAVFVGAGSNSNNFLSNTVLSSNNSGFYISSSFNNIFTNNNASYDADYGFLLVNSENNTFTNNTASYNDDNSWSAGFEIETNSDNNVFTNNTANNNAAEGFYFLSSNNSSFSSNNANNNSYGFYLDESYNNSFSNNNASYNAYAGIYLITSSDNIFSNDITLTNAGSAFYADTDCLNNTVSNLSFLGGTLPTNASFTFYGVISVNVSEAPAADPFGYSNVSRYLDITTLGAPTTWVFLNLSYADANVSTGFNASNVSIWRYVGAAWVAITGGGTNYAENYTYANLTSFSVFAALAGRNDAAKIIVFKNATNYNLGETVAVQPRLTYANDSVIAGSVINVTIFKAGVYNSTINVTTNATGDGLLTIDGLSSGAYSINASVYSNATANYSYGVNASETFAVEFALLQTVPNSLTFSVPQGGVASSQFVLTNIGVTDALSVGCWEDYYPWIELTPINITYGNLTLPAGAPAAQQVTVTLNAPPTAGSFPTTVYCNGTGLVNATVFLGITVTASSIGGGGGGSVTEIVNETFFVGNETWRTLFDLWLKGHDFKPAVLSETEETVKILSFVFKVKRDVNNGFPNAFIVLIVLGLGVVMQYEERRGLNRFGYVLLALCLGTLIVYLPWMMVSL